MLLFVVVISAGFISHLLPNTIQRQLNNRTWTKHIVAIALLALTVVWTQFQEAVEVLLNLAEVHVRTSADLIGILAQKGSAITAAPDAIDPSTRRLATELKTEGEVAQLIKAEYPALWDWLGGEIPTAQALKDKYVETIEGSDDAFSDPRLAPAHWAGNSLNQPTLDFPTMTDYS